jgi:predicted transcriptional regulator
MTPEKIRYRAETIRFPVRQLALAAGLDEDNVHRILKGRTDPRTSSLQRLSEALRDEERRLLDYLSATLEPTDSDQDTGL